MGTRREGRDPAVGGVGLPQGTTGSSFLHGALREAVARYPEALGDADVPESAAEFKRRYGEVLVRFEASRAGAPERSAIARSIVGRVQDQLRFDGNGFRGALREHLEEPGSPAAIEEIPLAGRPGLWPRVPLEGRVWAGGDVAALAEELAGEHRITRAAAAALEWLARRSTRDGGLDLSGQRFAVMGAGAEIAPTPLLLEAGASVLWIDPRDPTPLLGGSDELAGTLAVAPEARDLLREPRRIAATIGAFAGEQPVHVGMFAYAPGEGREWRLAAAMNAIVRALDPALVRSVSLFVSPTSPAVLQPEDVAAARERAGALPAWQALLGRAGLLDATGPYERNGVCVARTIVPLQGLSYQGAQYVSKLLAAESYALYGTGEDAGQRPVLSANVAGITMTQSMQHPVFQAAFAGAESLGLQVFAPETTRALSGLLVLHDLLNPDAPGAAATAPADPAKRAAALFSQQVHGGLYALPLAIEPALRVAAVLGLCRRPRLLLDLLR